tara:strand:- start:345 stop:1364 length:1020 start_codon:yes stop_codon:yes gene_type:complete
MSKKNSNVILKNKFESFNDLSQIFLEFEKKLDKLKSKKFLVAVSGGPDSLALTALTMAYGFKNKTKFIYVLINHNIRINSEKEAINVKSLLKKHKINLKIISIKQKISKNIQSQARKYRYKLLTDYCKKQNIKIILTAHNLEDQVETFLIRLSRGSGLTGLSSMRFISPLSNKILLARPLLDVKKRYLISISKKTFGKFFRDPSNTNKKYLRSKIRTLQKPLLKSGINYDSIFKSISNLASSKSVLDNYYKQLSQDIISKHKYDVSINIQNLNNLSDEIKIRIINDSIRLIKKNYYNPRSKKVEKLINKLKQKNFTRSTLGGCLFFKKNGKIWLKKEKK